MDGLEQAIGRAEAFDREQADKAQEYAQEAQQDQATVAGVDSMEAAANMAESLLKTGVVACKAFVDSRLSVDDEEVQQCRESLAPLIDKYNLAVGGGKLPYGEEISAGLYLGGLWRRFRRALTELRAKDKAERQAREQANNGDQRKHESEKPSQSVSGEVGLRQEPDADSPGWDSEQWGAGSAVGQQQGPSSTPV